MDKYIAEVAGKDSVAAILSFASDHNDAEIIPTVVITGTEYGDLSSYEKSIDFLRHRLENYRIVLTDTIYIRDGSLWNLMNARYQYCIYKKFHFFTPCITCHMYTHLLRIPIYRKYGARGLVTGERKSHSGKLKANQHGRTIAIFDSIFQGAGIETKRPLLETKDSVAVDSLIDDEDIIQHANDVKCVMSGNLQGFSLEQEEHISLLDKYLEEYVLPVGRFCAEELNSKGYVEKEGLECLIKEIINA